MEAVPTPAAIVKLLLSIFFAMQLSCVDYLSVLQKAADSQDFQLKSAEKLTFDYIIVGGGAAGCVLANRLSEDPNNEVLLIERGGDPNPLTQIPILTSRNLMIGSSNLAYIHKTTGQTHACGIFEDSCFAVTGRGLGGSSNINALINMRGSPQVFDEWAEITKDKSWSYENVLKVFKQVEDYHGYYKDGDSSYHGKGGEFYVGNMDREDTNPTLDYFFEATKSAGYPEIDINNGVNATNGGSAHFDFNVKNGVRWSVYKAFLQPILSRSNLHVYRYAHVTKVNFDKQPKATSITFTKDGKTQTVHARKEIILSAGTFGSAQLLMLSGIGPKADLEALGIPVEVDLPVGKKLMDHVSAPMLFSINKTMFFYPERDTELSDISNYVSTGKGNFGKVLGTSAALFTKSSIAEAAKNGYPDLELIYSSVLGAPLPTSDGKRDYFSMVPFLIAPKSVGDFKLKSKDPLDEPLINPNYLAHPDDLQAIVEGIQLSLKLMEMCPELKSLDLQFDPIPACSPFEFKSTEYWKCYAKNWGQTGFHFVGSNMMGDVVDSKLKVMGISGLRVIDASVMPVIPNAHTTAPTVMIAALGSTFILGVRDVPGTGCRRQTKDVCCQGYAYAE